MGRPSMIRGYNLLRTKHFHGVSSASPHAYSLKSRYGKVSDMRAVRGLKRVLKRSKAAKTLAVRQVTQDNRGKRTAGIDGGKKLKPTESPQMAATLSLKSKTSPVRRVWVPKPGKEKKRPLRLPTTRG